MKHVRALSRRPGKAASDLALFLGLFTGVLDAVAQFFVAKESQ